MQTWDATRGYEIAAGQRRGELAWEYYDLAHSSTGEVRLVALQEALRHAPDTMAFCELRGSIRAMLGEFDRPQMSLPNSSQRTFVNRSHRCSGERNAFLRPETTSVFNSNARLSLSRLQQTLSCRQDNNSLSAAQELHLPRSIPRNWWIANLPVENSEGQTDQNYYIGISLLRDSQYEEAARF